MTGKVVASVLVDLTNKLLFKFELSIVKIFLVTFIGLSRLAPNSAFSFPRQPNDNQVKSNNNRRHIKQQITNNNKRQKI